MKVRNLSWTGFDYCLYSRRRTVNTMNEPTYFGFKSCIVCRCRGARLPSVAMRKPVVVRSVSAKYHVNTYTSQLGCTTQFHAVVRSNDLKMEIYVSRYGNNKPGRWVFNWELPRAQSPALTAVAPTSDAAHMSSCFLFVLLGSVVTAFHVPVCIQ